MISVNFEIDINFQKEDIININQQIEEYIKNGIININIYNDDVMEWDDNDFKNYLMELKNVNKLIVKSFHEENKKISINVITDIFENRQNNNETYPICFKCPCIQCKINPDLFKQTTNSDKIPPRKYCKKSFLEFNNAQELIKELNSEYVLEDIDENSWIQLKIDLQSVSE